MCFVLEVIMAPNLLFWLMCFTEVCWNNLTVTVFPGIRYVLVLPWVVLSGTLSVDPKEAVYMHTLLLLLAFFTLFNVHCYRCFLPSAHVQRFKQRRVWVAWSRPYRMKPLSATPLPWPHRCHKSLMLLHRPQCHYSNNFLPLLSRTLDHDISKSTWPSKSPSHQNSSNLWRISLQWKAPRLPSKELLQVCNHDNYLSPRMCVCIPCIWTETLVYFGKSNQFHCNCL